MISPFVVFCGKSVIHWLCRRRSGVVQNAGSAIPLEPVQDSPNILSVNRLLYSGFVQCSNPLAGTASRRPLVAHGYHRKGQQDVLSDKGCQVDPQGQRGPDAKLKIQQANRPVHPATASATLQLDGSLDPPTADDQIVDQREEEVDRDPIFPSGGRLIQPENRRLQELLHAKRFCRKTRRLDLHGPSKPTKARFSTKKTKKYAAAKGERECVALCLPASSFISFLGAGSQTGEGAPAGASARPSHACEICGTWRLYV